jgi:thiosulfate reductase cytochrome b subunit
LLNAIAVRIMVTGGWQIYNASPIFEFEFPSALTLGGWLAGALLWHFAAMWLLVVNGLFYVTRSLVTGRFRAQLFPMRRRNRSAISWRCAAGWPMMT